MLNEKLINLTKQLYPTGRAFKLSEGGFYESLHIALAKSEERALNDAMSIRNSMLPDNDGFTVDDATDWERRLGMITNGAVSLADRKLAIARKMNYPGLNPAKGHYQHLEYQLQQAGFDVYVFENRFPTYPEGYITQTPTALSGISTANRYGQLRYGQGRYGSQFLNKVVNHIDEDMDKYFDTGSDLRSTFFVGANPVGSVADVPAERKNEFRQLILKIKPTQTVGFLFINYV